MAFAGHHELYDDRSVHIAAPCFRNREQWLQRFYEIGKAAVRPRNKGELYAFLIHPSDNFGPLLDILERGGVKIDFPGALRVAGRRYPQGTAVVRLAQPYGAFAKALLERSITLICVTQLAILCLPMT